MFTIYNALRSQGYTEAVVLDTEDTDNYVQAAYVAHQIPGQLGIKRKHQIIDARNLCTVEVSKFIIPLHVLTGCDHNSGFYGASKKVIAGRIQSCSEARHLLESCGRELPATRRVFEDLQQFVIKYIYSDDKIDTLAEARAKKWRMMKRKNTIRLPPDSDSLSHHLERANFLAYIQINYHLQTHPSPIGNGCHRVDGFCLPVRYALPALPASISLATNQEDLESGSDADASENSKSNSSDSSDSDV